MLFHADIGGEFVNAFLSDHGGIHIRQEQLLPACRGDLHDDVDLRIPQRGAQGLSQSAVVGDACGCQEQVGGNAGVQPMRCGGSGQGGGGAGEQRVGQRRMAGIGHKGSDMRHVRRRLSSVRAVS